MKIRTHTCGQLTANDEGQKVTLQCWVGSRRDLGGLIFFGIRDRFGTTQVVVNPELVSKDVMKLAEGVRFEFVLEIEGTVSKRPADQVRDNMSTGEVEVVVDTLTVLNSSKPLPNTMPKKSF